MSKFHHLLAPNRLLARRAFSLSTQLFLVSLIFVGCAGQKPKPVLSSAEAEKKIKIIHNDPNLPPSTKEQMIATLRSQTQ